jgi:hypothetical protein
MAGGHTPGSQKPAEIEFFTAQDIDDHLDPLTDDPDGHRDHEDLVLQYLDKRA